MTLYANKIHLMFRTNSIDFDAVSLRDLIWLETAFYIDMEMKSKIKEVEFGVNVDIRALLKDIDDVQRISKSGKTNAAIKWSDLPSQQNKNELKEENSKIRKEFLKNISNRFKNK